MSTPNTTPPIHNCGNCNASVHIVSPQDIRGQHECRALPPQLVALPAKGAAGGFALVPAGGWPVVDPVNGWCRMHHKREVSAAVAANEGRNG